MADESSAVEVEIDLDDFGDWETEDCTTAWGRDQSWLCFACGRSLTPAGESVVHLKPPGEGTELVPVVVHADCAVALIRSGRRLRDWLDRIRRDPNTYVEEQVAQALWGALKRRGMVAVPHVVDVGEGPVSLDGGLETDGGEVGEDLPPAGGG